VSRFTATRTWRQEDEHGFERVTLTLTTDAPSQAQADAEADAMLRRLVGFDPPPALD
jgi:hypothetical protein